MGASSSIILNSGAVGCDDNIHKSQEVFSTRNLSFQNPLFITESSVLLNEICLVHSFHSSDDCSVKVHQSKSPHDFAEYNGNDETTERVFDVSDRTTHQLQQK